MISLAKIARPAVNRGPSACATLGLQLAEACEQPSMLSETSREHVEVCLRCQAELASYRKLRRTLAGLRSVSLDVPDGQVDELLASCRPEAHVHRSRRGVRRRAYLGGVAAVTAAGAGAVVLAARATSRSALLG